MKKFFVLIAMLSVLLFGFSTAHAVFGVADDIPTTDITIPFICQVGGGLDTLWAIAETGGAVNKVNLGSFGVVVYTYRSLPVFDFLQPITTSDVVPDNCARIMSLTSPAIKAQMTITINGIDYYAGYIQYIWPVVDANRFISWVYLTDLSKGFASGFNGFGAEGFGVGARMEEEVTPVAARTFYPRYVFWNNSSDSWTWWMLLMGRNAYGIDAFPPLQFQRWLTGIMCNEVEDCFSLAIPIPNEWNIIDVWYYYAVGLHPIATWPKNGFANLDVYEFGYVASPSFPEINLYGTIDPLYFLQTGIGYYTALGWSYQRAFQPGASLSWDVVHPMHRTYCGGTTGAYIIDYWDYTLAAYVAATYLDLPGDASDPCFIFIP